MAFASRLIRNRIVSRFEPSRWLKTFKPIWQGQPVEIEFTYKRSNGKQSHRQVSLKKVLSNADGQLYLFGFCRKRLKNRMFTMDGVISDIRFQGEDYEPFNFIAAVLLGGKASSPRRTSRLLYGVLLLMIAAAIVLLVMLERRIGFGEAARPAAKTEAPAEKISAEAPAETPVSPEKNIPVINDETANDFIYRFAVDYVEMGMKLVRGYREVERERDFTRFETFRNQAWLPDYDTKRAYYNAVLEKSWDYLFAHDLSDLIANFSDLFVSSTDMKIYLKTLDKPKIEAVHRRFQQVRQKLSDLDKRRGLNLGEILSGLEFH
jgi:hypothetical protein